MIKQFQTFEELTTEAAAYLKSLSYSSKSINNYSMVWRNLGRYMEVQKISHYNANIGTAYLSEAVGNVEYKALSRWERSRIRIIIALSDFNETGTIRKRKKRKQPIQLGGPIGKVMSEHINNCEQTSNLAKNTVGSYQLYLSVFLGYLTDSKVFSFDKFNPSLLFDFIKGLGEYSVITRHLIILKTNQFLRYIYDKQILPIDYSRIIPKDKYIRQPKLPSYFSEQEIRQLINSIDRANPNGKRDYAMILLVIRFGLRCSDITNLKFDNILWERELITLTQKKTKQKIELPLLQEIGNAIIDYLKYSRPQSELPYIFLRQVPPYDNMDDNILNGIIKKYLNRSGIKYDERRHGPHALRHSLATRLLAKETPLPVISSVLGHASSESTMCYLRVDLNSLRYCALQVTPAIISTCQKTKKEVAK